MTDHILVTDSEDGVRTITMNRPDKRNALTVAMYDAMATAVATAGDNAGAVLIQGSGGFFTGGNDIMDFVANPPTGDDSAVFRFLYAILDCPVPVVASVQGPAVGIGTTMLLHCDVIHASPDARFSLPFIDLGLVPEAASSVLLPRLIGHVRAARMLMLGEALSAQEALEAGLITAIAPQEEVDAAARAAAATLAAKPRGAMSTTKSLMKPDRAELLAVMKKEGALFAQALRSPEAIAAFQSFLMKGRKG